MLMRLFITSLFFINVFLIYSQNNPIVLVSGNLIDVNTERVSTDVSIHIKAGKIAEILTDTLLPEPPEKLAQQQLDAYNARNIEAFLEPYSEDVEIYNFPDQLLYKGKDKMRSSYQNMFDNTPDLHCELVNRIVLGDTVIDQERVTGFPGRQVLEAVAIYKIANSKIVQVYFISK